MRKAKIVGKMVLLCILFAAVFTPVRIIGGLLTGLATGLGWVARDWRDLTVGYFMAMSDANKPEVSK